MPPPNATLQQLLDYLKDKATRYAEVARRQIERAEAWKAGTDQILGNPVLAARYEAAARDALQLAEKYAGYAMWLAMLRPLASLTPGEATLISATFVRRAAAEDFPNEAFVRLAGDQLVRLPMAEGAR